MVRASMMSPTAASVIGAGGEDGGEGEGEEGDDDDGEDEGEVDGEGETAAESEGNDERGGVAAPAQHASVTKRTGASAWRIDCRSYRSLLGERE